MAMLCPPFRHQADPLETSLITEVNVSDLTSGRSMCPTKNSTKQWRNGHEDHEEYKLRTKRLQAKNTERESV